MPKIAIKRIDFPVDPSRPGRITFTVLSDAGDTLFDLPSQPFNISVPLDQSIAGQAAIAAAFFRHLATQADSLSEGYKTRAAGTASGP